MTGGTVLIGGPTASAKSALALALAEAFDGVVINADSRQVYRELRILTSRPGPAEEARAPHRLYGVLPAAEACSVGRWRAMALAEIRAAHDAGKVPILVGGTGLYFRAITRGLAPVPAVPAEVRAAARARHARLGAEAFRAELAGRDPASAARLAPGDTQRLLRAWEVVEATGTPLSLWQQVRHQGTLEGPLAGFVLAPPRRQLYAACDARFAAMVEAGAVEEVAALEALGLDESLPAMKTLGVAELRRYLAGEVTLAEATAAAQRATRRYAKRQMTWFRHQMGEATFIEAQYSESVAQEVRARVARSLLTQDK